MKSTGMLRFEFVWHDFNSPNITSGKIVFTSKLKKPERFSFLSFYQPATGIIDEKLPGLLRLVGLPGDTIEIRNGDLYVNNEIADNKFDITTSFLIPNEQIKAALSVLKYDTFTRKLFHFPGSVCIELNSNELKQLKRNRISVTRYLIGAKEDNMYLNHRYSKKWSRDQFGPYIIPADSSFLMGDNRHSCIDSRQFGPVAISRWKGTVLNP
ncbi:MAG: signal peptidase I [Chitinophagaceae bacterium]|nr:signal peptidase I [Chitinophagaceae bacterium]